jgi:hypothetical protein
MFNQSIGFSMHMCLNNHQKYSNNQISRKVVVNAITFALCNSVLSSVINAQETNDNKPLTPAEMQEYNRLLKQAKQIQSIIDANKNSILSEENGVEKYLKEKNITISKNNTK